MDIAETAGRLIRYGTVGVLTNLGGYALFLTLLTAGLPPVPTTGITYFSLVAFSYFANRNWTFRSVNSHSRDITRYAIAYGLGLILALVAMHFLSALMHPAIAQIFVICLTAVAIYGSLELLRFGQPSSRDAD